MTEVIFGQDKMLGDFDKPAIWTKSENVEQLIPIHQNWNWIAFGVENTCQSQLERFTSNCIGYLK